MQACDSCKINVQTAAEFCPLCGTALRPAEPNTPLPLPHNDYPDLSGISARYNLVFRLLLFFSLLGAVLCALINWLVTPGFWWCLIVVAALCYLWLTVPPLLRRGVNYAKRTMYQAFFTCLLVVVLDILTGYRGWSVTYVIPALLDAAIGAVWIMVVFNRTSWNQYIFYQVVIGLFGLAPLVLYLLDLAQNLVMVLVTAALALASLLVSLVFGDKTLKNDFKRRFHL